MNIVMNLVLALQILTALVMIGLVLIQHGKGADMGASFGSGASGSLFGATGSANFLSRSTAFCAGRVLRLHARARLHRQRSAEGQLRQHPRPTRARRLRARRGHVGSGRDSRGPAGRRRREPVTLPRSAPTAAATVPAAASGAGAIPKQ